MDPIAFQIGPFPIHWYGILIVTGILVAAYLSTYTSKLMGENPELVSNILSAWLEDSSSTAGNVAGDESRAEKTAA